MWEPTRIQAQPKEKFFRELAQEFQGIRDTSFIANCANLSALLYFHMTQLNWAGVYLFDGHELVLGPFQGYPACVRIPLNKGVCGACARDQRILRVSDVEHFPGHIACDSRTKSEMVLPLVVDGKLIGVLDLDSPIADRFDSVDEQGVSELVRILLEQ